MKRLFASATALTMLAGLPLQAQAARFLCPPLFVTHGDQVVCAVANYNQGARDVVVEMTDGRDGALVEDALTVSVPGGSERGVHHNVVPPGGGTAPAHPVMCEINLASKTGMRASFARLADAASEPFPDTDAAAGGEMVECR